MPVALGGDHSVTYPIVKAYEDEEPLHVIHFDAHIDYSPFIHDLRFTNVHAFRHIAPMQHVLSPHPGRDPEPPQRRIGNPRLDR